MDLLAGEVHIYELRMSSLGVERPPNGYLDRAERVEALPTSGRILSLDGQSAPWDIRITPRVFSGSGQLPAIGSFRELNPLEKNEIATLVGGYRKTVLGLAFHVSVVAAGAATALIMQSFGLGMATLVSTILLVASLGVLRSSRRVFLSVREIIRAGGVEVEYDNERVVERAPVTGEVWSENGAPALWRQG